MSGYLLLYQLHFQPVPAQGELQRLIPTGTQAVAAKTFASPQDSFGPDSVEYIQRKISKAQIQAGPPEVDDGLRASEGQNGTVGSYAGAGSYF